MRALRTSALSFALGLTVACTGLQIPVPAPSGGTSGGSGAGTGSDPNTVAADVVRYTNNARTQSGRRALVTSSRLMEAARLHAEQMAAHQHMEHTISGARYPTMLSRLQAVRYDYLNAAENISWNQSNAQNAVTTWMNSSGHRANILDPNLTEIGAAMARSSRGEPYWIQVFGRPRSGSR